jgi:NDP-sugar pyrophosphorylase family protein
MKAVILAGGKGTRLAPYTTVLPKPLMPLGEMPILEIVIRQLKEHGVTEVILTVGYLGSLLEAYFGNGEKFGVKIRYSYESTPLGTAGPLALVDGLDNPFLVLNGDLLTNIDYGKMVDFHRQHCQIATIGLARKKVKIDLGVIELKTTGAVDKYIEKPTLEYLVSMGIYVFNPEVLDFVRGKGRLDLPDLVLILQSAGRSTFGFDSQCRWFDIGRPEDYATATEVFMNEREVFLKS